MREMVLAVLVALGAMAMAKPPEAPAPVSAVPERPFTLAVGGRALLREEGILVTFEAVESDSRCPKGVQCVWAGNAAVRLLLRRGKKPPVSLVLNTILDPRETRVGSRTLALKELSPYPRAGQTIDPSSYEATLVFD